MGVILISVGLLIAAAGVFIVINDKDNKAEKETETIAAISETSAVEKKSSKVKGNEFEAYVADILKKSGVTIKEWNQGTVTSNGAMGENALNPDFLVEQKGSKSPIVYWIEAKWRKKIGDSNFTLKQEQLERYKSTQSSTKRKVIVALGVGGEPGSPKAVYAVPVDSITEDGLSYEQLRSFYVRQPESNLIPHIGDWFFKEVFKK